MNQPIAGDNVVVSKLYDTHRALRQLTEHIETMADEVARPGGPERVRDAAWKHTVARYHDLLAQTMHAHHGTEDEVIFPYLTRQYGFDASALDAQHEELDATMASFRSSLIALLGPKAPSESELSAFATGARTLRERITTHLDAEEATAVVALRKLTRQDIQSMFGGRL